ALAPGGRYRQAQVREGQVFVRWYLPLADTERHVLSPTAASRADDAVAKEFNQRGIAGHLESWGLRVPKVCDCALRFAPTQVSVALARVAIALERHRLVHRDYPDTLAALSPQFIDRVPPDLINGQSLHYRREKDQRFILYSVGWNEADDG